jgi:class 3 adenylate cyclase
VPVDKAAGSGEMSGSQAEAPDAVRCPNCNTENPPSTKFCAECGTSLGVPCPECQFRNPIGAQHCGNCGHELKGAVSGAERRHLTVFFADLVGSTTLSEILDPEELRELYATYQAISVEAVQRYSGHLAQYLGDGILAYFGFPAAHEDDAVRAVHAGLEILDGLGRLGTPSERPSVRIGIHTGLVVIGDVGMGNGRGQMLALGEAPNIAARVQSEAEPDTLLISGDTRRLIAGSFALEELGPRTLKGISRPLQLFRVTGKSDAPSRFHAKAAVTGLTPFVGREQEVQAIAAAWEEVANGHGQTVLIRGEAGIGKSRLLGAAKEAAGNRLHEVFEGECSPYHSNSALHPIIEMLERRMGLEHGLPTADKLDLLEQFAAGRGVPLEEAVSLLAALYGIPTGDRYPPIELSPARQRQRTLEVLAQLLLHSVGGSPILLTIEDLHWADPTTLDLVGELVARQATAPLFLVCTTRPELTAGWLEQLHAREIDVAPLPQEDTRALVASVVGNKKLPTELLQEVINRTGGVPLFVEAVTRTVIEAGVLRELEDRYELAGPLPSELIPETVHDSLMDRIDRLGEDKQVAQLAAAMGREFSFELLQDVLGKSVEGLANALEHLVDLELVSKSGDPPAAVYTFKHALIQDAAYESLLRKTRQEFHGKIAEALSDRFPELAESQPELLARHFEGAGRTDEAIASWMKAGLQAQRQSALLECAAHLRHAIALLDLQPADDPRRLQSEMEAQLALWPALMATLGWGSPEVEAACIRSRELCEMLQNGDGLLASLWGLWTVYFLRANMDEALEAAKPVLELALAAESPVLQIAARQAVGYTSYFRGEFLEALRHAETALGYYDLEQERALVEAFQLPLSFACSNFRSMSLWLMGYPERAERQRQAGREMIEELAISAGTAYGLGNELMIHYARRDRAAIAPIAERLHDLSTEEGYLLWAAQSRIYRGWVQTMEGDAVGGIGEMEAGLNEYRLTGSAIMMPQFCLMKAEAQLQAERPGEALASLSEGLKICAEHNERVPEPELQRLKGEIQIAQGATSAGEASLRKAIEVARAQQARMLELRAGLALAGLLRDQGRDAEARAELQPLLDWFIEEHDTPELVDARALLDTLAA